MAIEECSQLSDMGLTIISEQNTRPHRVAKPLLETSSSPPLGSARTALYRRWFQVIPALSRLHYRRSDRYRAQRPTFEGSRSTFEGSRSTSEGSERRRGLVACYEIPANAFLFLKTGSTASPQQMIDLWGKPTDPQGKKYRPLRELRPTFEGKMTDPRGKKYRPLREGFKLNFPQKRWFYPTEQALSVFVFLSCTVLINNTKIDSNLGSYAELYEQRQGRRS